MVERAKQGLWFVTDKLTDGLIYCLDEVKFWGEVVSEFLELDGTSSDRHLYDVRQQVRQQIEEAEQYDKEVDAILKAQGQLEEDDVHPSAMEKEDDEDRGP